MNKEVNFEIAKLLKEKRITIGGFKYYDNGGILNHSVGFISSNAGLVLAPTIAEAVMWMYEKHGIWIFPDYGKKTNSWYYNIQTLAISNHPERILWESGYSSPTEAYEAAIEYTLKNLI